MSATGRRRQAKSSESGVYALYMSISGFLAIAACEPKAHSDTALQGDSTGYAGRMLQPRGKRKTRQLDASPAGSSFDLN